MLRRLKPAEFVEHFSFFFFLLPKSVEFGETTEPDKYFYQFNWSALPLIKSFDVYSPEKVY